MARIGIFGGSFDPVHNGHLALARFVCEQRALDRVLFIPAGWPPHKGAQKLAPGADRVAMLRLATAGEARFSVSDIELQRGGKSYTLKTVRQLAADLGEEDELFLVVGGDMLADVPNWWHADELLHEVGVIGTGRPGAALDAALDVFCMRVPADVCARTRGLAVRMPPVDVSATEVRRRVAGGQSVAGLVPDAVAAYIEEHGLYRGADG